MSELHYLSLKLAEAFRNAYNVLGCDHEITKQLLENYKAVRRMLPVEETGKRMGSTVAYEVIQGYI